MKNRKRIIVYLFLVIRESVWILNSLIYFYIKVANSELRMREFRRFFRVLRFILAENSRR